MAASPRSLLFDLELPIYVEELAFTTPGPACAASAPANGECYLLNKLPSEIHLTIYDFLWLGKCNTICVDVYTNSLEPRYSLLSLPRRSHKSTRTDIGLLATSKLIRKEALPVYYSWVAFELYLRIEPQQSIHNPSLVYNIFGAFRHMRSLELSISVDDDAHDEKTADMGFSALACNVAEMNTATQLKTLKLRVSLDTAGQHEVDQVIELLGRLRRTGSVECGLSQVEEDGSLDTSKYYKLLEAINGYVIQGHVLLVQRS